MEKVIVERRYDEPIDLDMGDMAEKAGWCLDMHGVRHLGSYLSADRRRMFCVFEAPDAESVRLVNRQVGLPFESVWTASVHEPPARPANSSESAT